MDFYKLQSLALILVLYIVLMLPTIIISLIKKDIDKKSFVKLLSVCTLIEIVLFSIIYMFPRQILRALPIPQNIENYSFYSLKILFIASIFTVIHYALPIYLVKKEKKKKAITLFSLKLIYVPVLVFLIFNFPIKFALFSMPILDLIYSIFLGIYFIKYC